MSDFALALGGGGARGIAHIHVIEALDELGVRPKRIVGSSIGAIMGAGYAAGMTGAELRAFALESFARKRLVLSRLWRTRPTPFQDFMIEGALRFGPFDAERVLSAFLPDALPPTFERLQISLGVMATDFYARTECEIDSGGLLSALAASAAIPAVFSPVRRDGKVLIDGGIFNPLPFDRLRGKADLVVAVDVNGGPVGSGDAMPTQTEAVFGASQLMMQSITDSKLRISPPDLLLRPPVLGYRVLDFLRTRQILEETASFREETKQALDRLLSGKTEAGKTRPETAAQMPAG
ncbi:patatin-like phospholipase family protein [Aurantimonas marianensis]|uniref:Patatin-like phospholipase family protein n=1 Tax=Aurantimonas marianensis TaxID=2920428 RepID=A0A9X2H522_9HYPH|nr:patatin-like phospholipase family protein [Aurantimonas marianensis]